MHTYIDVIKFEEEAPANTIRLVKSGEFYRAYSTFNISLVITAGVPCLALHRLPILYRHYVTFLCVNG